MFYFLKFRKYFYLIVLFTSIFQTNSFAYLDPGSTSIILQMLSVALASVLMFYNYIKNKIILFFQKIKKIYKDKKLK